MAGTTYDNLWLYERHSVHLYELSEITKQQIKINLERKRKKIALLCNSRRIKCSPRDLTLQNCFWTCTSPYRSSLLSPIRKPYATTLTTLRLRTLWKRYDPLRLYLKWTFQTLFLSFLLCIFGSSNLSLNACKYTLSIRLWINEKFYYRKFAHNSVEVSRVKNGCKNFRIFSISGKVYHP